MIFMTEAVIVALITGACSVLGVWIANAKQQAIIVEKISQLEKKQDKHNNIIERMAKAEAKIESIESELK